jgi:hypothetical protein
MQVAQNMMSTIALRPLTTYKNFIIMIFAVALTLFCTNCSSDEPPIKNTLTFTINTEGTLPGYILLSDTLGNVLDTAFVKDQETITMSVSGHDTNETFNLTSLVFHPNFCFINTYTELSPGDYNFGRSFYTPNTILGKYNVTINIDDNTDVWEAFAYGPGIESASMTSNDIKKIVIETSHSAPSEAITLVGTISSQAPPRYKRILDPPLNGASTQDFSTFTHMENVINVPMAPYEEGGYSVYTVPDQEDMRIRMYRSYIFNNESHEFLKIYYPRERPSSMTTEIKLYKPNGEIDFHRYTGSAPPAALKTLPLHVSSIEYDEGKVLTFHGSAAGDVVCVQAYNFANPGAGNFYQTTWSVFGPAKNTMTVALPQFPQEILDAHPDLAWHFFDFDRVICTEFSDYDGYKGFMKSAVFEMDNTFFFDNPFLQKSDEIILATRFR